MKKIQGPIVSLIIFLVLSAMFLLFFVISSILTTKGYEEMLAAALALQDENALTVIIDAGHGGEDPGAVANGVREKDINLNIAYRLKEMFLMSGYDVVMTREEDKLLSGAGVSVSKKQDDLLTRLAFTKDSNNCIFISIHQNKFGLDKVHGMQNFYGLNDENSKALAELVQREGASIADVGNKRVIKPGKDIYILEKATCPAILVECGFLSNSEEARRLTDGDYQTRLAFSIYKAVTDFYGERCENNIRMQ